MLSGCYPAPGQGPGQRAAGERAGGITTDPSQSTKSACRPFVGAFVENQSRLLFLLAAALLALVAVIALSEPGEDEDGAGEDGASGPGGDGQEWARLWPELEADEIARLELALPDEVRVFERQEQGWRILSPVVAAADTVRVEALVDSLVTVEAGQVLDGPPADFGLLPPRATITLTTTTGEQQILRVGRDAPVGWHSYVQAGAEGPDAGPTRPTRTKLSAHLEMPVSDLRQRSLWALPRTAVDGLQVRAPELSLDLERRDGDWWVRAADAPPAEARRADPLAVEGLLATLGQIEATGFVQAPEFHAEALPWQIQARAAGSSQILAAGQTSEGAWVASGPLQEGLVTLDPMWNEALLRPITDWWAADLIEVDELSLVELAVHLGDRRLQASRSEAGWSPSEAGRMVEALQAVRVERGLAPAPEAPADGTAEGTSWGRIELTRADGSHRALVIHQEVDGGARVVVDEAGGAPFLLSALELGRLEGALP